MNISTSSHVFLAVAAASDDVKSITVEDLKTSLRSLGEISEEKLSGIAHILDSNKDGRINLEEAISAIEVFTSTLQNHGLRFTCSVVLECRDYLNNKW